jgi:hypothetical protein
MSAINYIELAKAAKAAAADCIAQARRQDQGCHFTQRAVEVLAIDDRGERIEPVLDWIEVKEISGKRLQRIVEQHAPAQYHHIAVQGGLDCYSSFADAMQYPDDYEPLTDCWDVDSHDLPDHRAERIPLEESAAAARSGGMGVAQRIDQWTTRQQRAQR